MPPTKKSLGQHWLHDEASLTAMCEAAQVQAEDIVLEVGPGLGTLTSQLLTRVKQVIAVEFDEDLARQLPHNVQERLFPTGHTHQHTLPTDTVVGDLRVVMGDILQFDLTALDPGYKVVANIPYYLTSNLLRVLSESTNPFARAALLVQKEVAQRVCAQPGDMSILSVSVQYYSQVSLGQLVPAALFTPPPKVDSQILILQRRPEPLFPHVDTKQFFRLVKAGFSQRRKTLLNALGGGLHLDRAQTTALLQAAGIDPGTRAQNISLDQWHALYLVMPTQNT